MQKFKVKVNVLTKTCTILETHDFNKVFVKLFCSVPVTSELGRKLRTIAKALSSIPSYDEVAWIRIHLDDGRFTVSVYDGRMEYVYAFSATGDMTAPRQEFKLSMHRGYVIARRMRSCIDAKESMSFVDYILQHEFFSTQLYLGKVNGVGGFYLQLARQKGEAKLLLKKVREGGRYAD